MRAIATVIAAWLALATQAGLTAAHAANATGHCTGMTVTDYVSSDASDYQHRDSFADITDGHLSFATTTTGCVMIRFSAVTATAGGSSGTNHYVSLHLRTVLDDHFLCVPALYNDTIHESMDPSPWIATSIIRVCKNVAPGSHTVQVQFRNGIDGDVVAIWSHLLAVTHN